MHSRRQDRIVVKALLMSAGFLAVPSGIIAADGVDSSPKDVLQVQQEVDALLEQKDASSAFSEQIVPFEGESLPKSEETGEEMSAPSPAEDESSEKSEEPKDADDSLEASLEEEEASPESAVDEESTPKSTYRPVSEQLEAFEDSSSRAEDASLEASPSSEAGKEEESQEVPPVAFDSYRSANEPPQMALYSLRSADVSNGREAPANVVSAFQRKEGLFYDKTGALIRDRWVEYQGEYYFPNAQGELYHDRFITFGPNVAYYMDETGMQYRGVLKKDDKLYLLDEVTARLHKDYAWVHQSTGDYFPNADGELYHDRFITFGPDVAYYMDEDGKKASGVVEVDDELYLLDDEAGDGKLRKDNAWVSYQGKNYFPNQEGKLYHDRAITFGPKVSYYMGSDGSSQSGIHEWNGKRFFYDPALHNQSHTTPGVICWNGEQYFIGSDGAITTEEMVVVKKEPNVADSKGQLHQTDRRLVLDISQWQNLSEMDFDNIAKNVSGVILRAGGTGWGTGESYFEDDMFDHYYEEFSRRGVPVGAYWYSCANTEVEGVAEARYFIDVLDGRKLELPVYWDTEDEHHQRDTSTKKLTDTGIAFLSTMEEAGYYSGIYASSSWLKTELDMDRLKAYDVWVAHYGVHQPNYQGSYGMWQFTSSFRLEGFPHDLDANWMYYDYPKIIKGSGLNNY